MNLGDLPGDLGGNHPLATWLNRLKRAVARRTPLPGVGYQVRQGEGGVSYVIIPGGGGKNATALSVVTLRLVKVLANTLKCSDGTNTVYVAKPWLLRNNMAQRVIRGTTVSYVYDGAVGSATRFQLRVASASGFTSETQVVTPPWCEPAGTYLGDEIKAINIGSVIIGDVDVYAGDLQVSATHLSLDEQRAWALATSL